VFEYKAPVAGSCDQDNGPTSYIKSKNFLTTEMTITCRRTVFVIYKNSVPSDYANGRLWNRLRPILYLIELFSFGFSLVHLKTPIQRVPKTLSCGKASEREADHSHASSDEVDNEWNCTSTPS